jgi:hypothetical protein
MIVIARLGHASDWASTLVLSNTPANKKTAFLDH